MIADLAQDVDASKGLAVASKDGIHLLAVEVGPVQVPLLLAQLAEQHLRSNMGKGRPGGCQGGSSGGVKGVPRGC